MTTTTKTLLDYISLDRAKRAGSNEYHMPCPFCGGDDRFIYFEDTDRWVCRQCDSFESNNNHAKSLTDFVMKLRNCTFKEAAAEIGTLDTDGKFKAPVTKRMFRNLKEYANAQGVDPQAFIDAGWKECTHKERPALSFPVRQSDGVTRTRYRFLDGEMPKYISEFGYTPYHYGYNKACAIAGKKGLNFLILCNGEASTIVAQFYGLPAFCVAGGEGNAANELALHSFLQDDKAWVGQFVIAFDADETGRKAAANVAQKIGKRASVIELPFQSNSGGDLGNFAALYRYDSLAEFQKLLTKATTQLSATEAAQNSIRALDIRHVADGRILINPFTSLHHFGGELHVMSPRLVTLVGGATGTGKTSWLETLAEMWMRSGRRGIYDGAEFTPDQYHARRLQRYSGQVVKNPLEETTITLAKVDYLDIQLWELYKQEERDGVPAWLRQGKTITKAQQYASMFVADMVSSWSGHIEYTPNSRNIEETLLYMTAWIHAERTAGRYVDFAIFDYAQMYSVEKEGTENGYQTAVHLIKKFAQDNNIHCIVGSQVNKDAEDKLYHQGRILTEHDLKYINANEANACYMLSMRYETTSTFETPRAELVPNTLYQAGIVNVTKNTMGRKGVQPLCADLAHFTWLDKPYNVGRESLPE